MTAQDKKEYLKRYRFADNEIDDLLRQKEQIMARLTQVTPKYSGMPGGGDNDAMVDGVERLLEVEREINERVAAAMALRREIETCIDGLTSNAQRRLLRLRYIEGLSWGRIGQLMGYDRTWVWRIHGKAIEALNVV